MRRKKKQEKLLSLYSFNFPFIGASISTCNKKKVLTFFAQTREMAFLCKARRDTIFSQSTSIIIKATSPQPRSPGGSFQTAWSLQTPCQHGDAPWCLSEYCCLSMRWYFIFIHQCLIGDNLLCSMMESLVFFFSFFSLALSSFLLSAFFLITSFLCLVSCTYRSHCSSLSSLFFFRLRLHHFRVLRSKQSFPVAEKNSFKLFRARRMILEGRILMEITG